MQLAREPRPLELLCVDDAAQGVAADALGEVDGDRRPRDERLGEAHVPFVEARVGAELVVRDDDADRLAAHDQRHVDRGGDAELAGDALVDLGVVDDGVDALGLPALEHASDLRRAELEACPEEVVGTGTRGRGDAEPAAGVGQRDQHEPRLDELLQCAGRRATSSGPSSTSEASALPISLSVSSSRSQRVDDSYRRAFSIATAACAASSWVELLVLRR